MKFDGLAATQHELPMNQLGNALIGSDKIINSGLIAYAYGRLPKRGERFDLVVTAKEPKQGSMEIIAILQHSPWMLPIVQDFIITGGVDASFRVFSYILTKLGGRPREADMHLEALMQMNRDHLEARNVSENNRLDSDRQWQSTLLSLVDKLQPSASQAVSPIGKGASTLLLTSDSAEHETTIDEPMADAIRSKQDDEVGDMEKMTINVDGITHHNRQLKIKHPNIDGKFIVAEVRDPNFDAFPNAYTEAASNLSSLTVHAKPMLRNGELHRLYIMDLAHE